MSFKNDIAPILVQKCLACHDAKKGGGGFRAHTFARLMKAGENGATVVPGKPEAGSLFKVLVATDKAERMPKDADPLPAAQIALVKLWIEQGAPFDGPDKAADIAALVPSSANPDPPLVYKRPVPLMALAFSPDGKELAAGGYHEVTVWNASNGKLLRRIKDVGRQTHGLAFSPDGALLAVASGTPGESGELKAFDPKTGKLVRAFDKSDDVFLSTAFSPDGVLLAAGGADRTVRVYEAASGKLLKRVKQNADWVTQVAFSRDGTLLAAAGQDNMVKVFEPRSGRLECAYPGHGRKVFGAAFDPEGDTLCTAGEDGRIHLWRPREFAAFDGTAAQMEDRFKKNPPVRQIAGLPATLSGVAVWKGRVISAAGDTVRIHDLKTLQPVRELAGHRDIICSLALHAASGRLATGSFDGEVRLWNLEDGKPLATFVAAPGK